MSSKSKSYDLHELFQKIKFAYGEDNDKVKVSDETVKKKIVLSTIQELIEFAEANGAAVRLGV